MLTGSTGRIHRPVTRTVDMVLEWLDWFAGWETRSGLLVLDDPSILPVVLASDWGRGAPRVAVLPADGCGVVPVDGGAVLRIRPYREVRLLPVDGWTVATVHDESDLAEFVADADRARSEGRLPPVLTDPRVQLADVVRWGWPWPGAEPVHRGRVRVDGTVTWGPHPDPIGTVDEPVELVTRRWRSAQRPVPHPGIGDFLSVMTGARVLRAHLSIHSSPQTLDPLLAVDRWPRVEPSGLLRLTLHGRTWTVDVRHRRVLQVPQQIRPDSGVVLSVV